MKTAIKFIMVLFIVLNMLLTYFAMLRIGDVRETFLVLNEHITANCHDISNSDVNVSSLDNYVDSEYIFQGVVKNIFVALDIIKIILFFVLLLIVVFIVLNCASFVILRKHSKKKI
jgi:hypothetical protein